MNYYYISGIMGITISGSFTKNKRRWIIFNELERERIELCKNKKPYGATRLGLFVSVEKY